MFHFRKVLTVLLVLFLLSMAGLVAAATEVPSIVVPKAPVLDGNGQDAAWKNVQPQVIVDTASGKKILLRSVYTADKVFFLVQYPDAAQNFLHKPWVWNDGSLMYEVGPHREDTFVFKWNMMDKDVNLSSFSDDNYRADVWYWKANRTNPAGFADDKTQILADTPSKKSTEKSSLSGKKRHLSRLSDALIILYRS